MNELKKSIHDNTTGLDYTLVNNHYLPNCSATRFLRNSDRIIEKK